MLPFSAHLDAACTVYDCMDELANFRFAPPELIPLERQLLAAADLVFTGGYSLFEAKRAQHPSVHPFPSSVDVAHFAAARTAAAKADSARLPHPCLGFYGVIDERSTVSRTGGSPCRSRSTTNISATWPGSTWHRAEPAAACAGPIATPMC